MTESSEMQFYYTNSDGIPVFEWFSPEGKQFLFFKSKGISPELNNSPLLKDDNTEVCFNENLQK